MASYSDDEGLVAENDKPVHVNNLISLEEKYSHSKFIDLVNKLKIKLQYEQKEWDTTVELIRHSAEFIIYSEKYQKAEFLETIKEQNMLDIFIDIMETANDPQIYS